jgi:hypothetical protein
MTVDMWVTGVPNDYEIKFSQIPDQFKLFHPVSDMFFFPLYINKRHS